VFASRHEEADWISHNNWEREYPFEALKDFDGTKFVIEAPCSGRTWLGFNYGYVEAYRFVVLRVGYGNAKQLKTVAEIPKGRGPRSMTVGIP
jgi:hypothetical protein